MPPESSTGDVDNSVQTDVSVNTETSSVASTQTDVGEQNSPSPSETETQDVKKPSSTLEAVTAALDAKKGGSPSDSEDKSEVKEETKAADDKKPVEEDYSEELTDEELNSYKPKTQRRIKQFREKVTQLSSEIQELRPVAQIGESLLAFGKRTGLSNSDINDGLELMALLRSDPVEAYRRLTPVYDAVRKASGATLPDDLAGMVEAGMVDPSIAYELSMGRAKNTALLRQQQEANEQAVAEAQERNIQAEENLKRSVTNVVDDWANKWKATDPDYAHKYPFVMNEMKLQLQERAANSQYITSESEALALMKAIKSKVDKDLKVLLPRREATLSVNGAGVQNNAVPKPRSTREAIELALGI